MSRADTWPGFVWLCLASVSRCRAAGRRWGAGATFALQMPIVSNTRHQTKGKPAPLRTCLERFAPTVPTAANRVGTREAPVYAVSPLPPLSPLQMSVPRGATPGRWVGFGLAAGLIRACVWPALLPGVGLLGGGTPVARFFGKHPSTGT
jgi:hypothetical protein